MANPTDTARLCTDCPRLCRKPRSAFEGAGFCGEGDLPRIARAALHFYEEPCISGSRGSGTVFFSGCNLRCSYCQNAEISRNGKGVPVTVQKLRDVFRRLQDEGACNINLVTPSHFTAAIADALAGADLHIPVVYNSSGYDCVTALRRLSGLIDIYMPDLKYLDSGLSTAFSACADYPDVAKRALDEMFDQVGSPVFDEDGLMKKGLLIRHMMLPGYLGNTLDVIDYVSEHFKKDSVVLSLMCQYTPMPWSPPELSGTVSAQEYAGAVSYLQMSGIKLGYIQDPASVSRDFIPDFDLTGTQ